MGNVFNIERHSLHEKVEKLKEAGFTTIGQLAEASDAVLLRIDTIGTKSLNRIKDVVYQAIWM